MKVEKLQLAIAARTARSVKSFRRTEECLFRSRHCLEKSYQLFHRHPRIDGACAKRKAAVN